MSCELNTQNVHYACAYVHAGEGTLYPAFSQKDLPAADTQDSSDSDSDGGGSGGGSDQDADAADADAAAGAKGTSGARCTLRYSHRHSL